MKNTLKVFGIIALVAVIGFAMTGCGGNGGGGGPTFLGDTLNLTGQVYLMDDDFPYRLTRYQGNREVTAHVRDGVGLITNGVGAITNGQFSFTFGRLNPEYLQELDDLGWDYEDIWYGTTISPSNARGGELEFIVPSGYLLWRGNRNVRESGNTVTWTFDGVRFVYVDRDVTVSSGELNVFSITRRAFSLNLQHGWNAVRFTYTYTWGPTVDGSGTITISLGNPNVNWVLSED